MTTNTDRSLFFFLGDTGKLRMSAVIGPNLVETTDTEQALYRSVTTTYDTYLQNLRSPGYSGAFLQVKDVIQSTMEEAQADIVWEFAASKKEMTDTLASRKPEKRGD